MYLIYKFNIYIYYSMKHINEHYKNKYLKYKNKYYNLSKKHSGGNPTEQFIVIPILIAGLLFYLYNLNNTNNNTDSAPVSYLTIPSTTDSADQSDQDDSVVRTDSDDSIVFVDPDVPSDPVVPSNPVVPSDEFDRRNFNKDKSQLIVNATRPGYHIDSNASIIPENTNIINSQDASQEMLSPQPFLDKVYDYFKDDNDTDSKFPLIFPKDDDRTDVQFNSDDDFEDDNEEKINDILKESLRNSMPEGADLEEEWKKLVLTTNNNRTQPSSKEQIIRNVMNSINEGEHDVSDDVDADVDAGVDADDVDVDVGDDDDDDDDDVDVDVDVGVDVGVDASADDVVDDVDVGELVMDEGYVMVGDDNSPKDSKGFMSRFFNFFMGESKPNDRIEEQIDVPIDEEQIDISEKPIDISEEEFQRAIREFENNEDDNNIENLEEHEKQVELEELQKQVDLEDFKAYKKQLKRFFEQYNKATNPNDKKKLEGRLAIIIKRLKKIRKDLE